MVCAFAEQRRKALSNQALFHGVRHLFTMLSTEPVQNFDGPVYFLTTK
jgi:hypothetical protein